MKRERAITILLRAEHKMNKIEMERKMGENRSQKRERRKSNSKVTNDWGNKSKKKNSKKSERRKSNSEVTNDWENKTKKKM